MDSTQIAEPETFRPHRDVDTLSDDLCRWRPIHYLGSKLRIVEEIRALLDQVDPALRPVCDLFAGSGSVSAALASTRAVTAVDIQEYSRVVCSAMLTPASMSGSDVAVILRSAKECSFRAELLWACEPLIDYEQKCLAEAQEGRRNRICDLLDGGSILAFQLGSRPMQRTGLALAMQETNRRLERIDCAAGPRAVVLRHFGGIYFSYRQATELAVLLQIASQHDGTWRDCLFAASMSTASEIVNTVGRQFAQPLQPRDQYGKPKNHIVQQILRDRQADVVSVFASWLNRYSQISITGRPHRAIRADYSKALSQHCDGIGIIYADPPYTRDHYSRFYHVLETMCKRDDPDVSVLPLGRGQRLSRGIYRVDRHQSPFCIKSQAADAFRTLFAGAKNLGAPLVLSYSPLAATSKPRPRVMSVEQLTAIARRFYTRVEVAPIGRHAHNKLNNSKNNSETSQDAELVLVCR